MFRGKQLFRTAVFSILSVGGFLLALLTLHQLVFPVLAWVWPGLEPTFYDLGVWGAFSPHNYVSSNISAPRVSHPLWDNQCDNGYVFLTPQGSSVDHPGPAILDGKGDLVWMTHKFGTVANNKVQEYKGQNYLTFWAGHKAGTFGQGVYYMLDSTYKTVRTVSAVGVDLFGDLHEFKITREGTALMTVYNVTNMDLTSMGRPQEGWIIDSLFQEIDIESGELLFQWRASDHYNAMDSFATNPFAGYRESVPFDFFHINSVEKDAQGNYIVSSRHTHTVTCISPTGETLWILGGHRNQFKDLSSGKATDFSWQHDARWAFEENSILTLFDNGDAGPLHMDAPYSSGRMIQLDVVNRTAKLLHQYVSLQKTRTASQGSVQILPGSNNTFIGWGHSAAYSEYTPDGTLVCETHFGASWFYWWGRIVSYRSFKSNDWHGAPEYPPTAKTHGSKIYVSWNGATEVVSWELQGANLDDEFHAIDVVAKTGFETSFALLDGYMQYRVAALDRDGKVLNHSNSVQKEPGWKIVHFLFITLLFAAAIGGGRFMFKLRQRRSGGRGAIKYSPI